MLTYVVERFEPFHCTTELLTKLLPVTVKVDGPLPTVRALGETPLRVGAPGDEMMKAEEAWPPPGAGLVTVTVAVPLAAKFTLEIAAVIWDPPTTVASFAVPFQVTVELETKFDPEIVSVKLLVPAAAVDGEID